MKRLIKFVKDYFLFFSVFPIIYSVLFGAILFGIWAGITAVFFGGAIVSYPAIVAFSIFIGAHFFLVAIIKDCYITTDCDSLLNFSETILFRFVVKKDGERVMVKYPTWIRGNIYDVVFPESGQQTLTRDLVAKHNNIHGKVNLKLHYEAEIEYNREKLMAVAKTTTPQTTYKERKIYFEEFISMAFKQINEENGLFTQMEKMIEERTEGKINDLQFINQLSKIIILPNDIFGTPITMSFELSSPEFFIKGE